jgi:hypothetical protein
MSKVQTAKDAWKAIVPALIQEEIAFRFNEPQDHLYIDTDAVKVSRDDVENALLGQGVVLSPDEDDPNQHRFALKEVDDVGVQVTFVNGRIDLILLWPKDE